MAAREIECEVECEVLALATAAQGHIRPLAAIAQSVSRMGHRVTLGVVGPFDLPTVVAHCSSDPVPADVRDECLAAGVTVRVFILDGDAATLPAKGVTYIRASKLVPRLLERFGSRPECRPAVVVFEGMALEGYVCAKVWSARAIKVNLAGSGPYKAPGDAMDASKRLLMVISAKLKVACP